MNEPNQRKVNPNTADLETLTQIPGIGPEIAQKIIAARPFESLVELSRVSGIGSISLERYLPYLTLISDNEEEQPDAGALEAEAEIESTEDETSEGKKLERAVQVTPPSSPVEWIESAGAEVEKTKTAAEAEAVQPEAQTEREVIKESAPQQPGPPVQTAPAARQNWVTRGQAFGLMFVGFLFTLILGLVLSLGILAGINKGQLLYANPAQINTLTAQAQKLDSRASAIEQDIQGMRERLDNMEALGARVREIEKNAEALATDIGTLQSGVEDAASQMSDLSDEVNSYGSQIEGLQSQVDQFSGFLDGLRALLDNLVPTPEGNK